MKLLLIAIGGALGAMSRYGMAALVSRYAPPAFPAGTFAVNVLGCALFGVLAGWAQSKGALGPDARAFLFVGLLGGFTTFSTFAFETVDLLRSAQWSWAVLNVSGQIVAGVVGLWAGLILAGRA